MTVRKHFKQIVRERMKKTGESYTSARRQILQSTAPDTGDSHRPGSIPATTALRVLLGSVDVKNPITGEPFTEAMLFGIAGGVGIGVAAFHYAKEDFSSFFIAGRHLWFDDVAYLQAALGRFGIKPIIQETGGAKAAEKQLRDTLEKGPCIAWVDMAHLPHRALPTAFSGGGYHVVSVLRCEGDRAFIGDLTDEAIEIAMADLAISRARIAKQKHRLLSISETSASFDLPTMVSDGLTACHGALTAKPGKGPLAMSSLVSLKKWAERLHGSKDKDAWEKIFLPGPNLWRGLTSMHLFIEMYGTGGGLCRPIMADFLAEAGTALKDERYQKLAEQYVALGRGWSELALAALPEEVPAFKEARELHNRYAELVTTGGTIEDKKNVWTRLDELAAEASRKFPLTAAEADELRKSLQDRARGLIEGEEKALAAMKALL